MNNITKIFKKLYLLITYKNRTIILVVILYFLFSSLFGLSKNTLKFSEPFFSIGLRMLIGGIALLSHQLIFNRKAFSIKLSDFKYFIFLGVINIYLTNITEICGIQNMSSAKACLIYSLSPFLSIITSYFLLRERITFKKFLGLGLGFVGLVPIFIIQPKTNLPTENAKFFISAEVFLIIAVFSSVFGWGLLKKIINVYKYSPLLANGISMIIGGILALFHSYLSGEFWNPIPVTQFWPFLKNTLLMCLISNFICYNLYGYLLKFYSSIFMSFAGLITPIFAAIFGWYFLDEIITWHYFSSVIMFLFGLSIFYHAELKSK